MRHPIGLVYTTFENNVQAKKIVRTLIEQNIAKCANIMAPHTAIYEWENKLEETSEVAVLIKCSLDQKSALIEKLNELHPYDVPCILDIDARAIPQYAQWLMEKV